MKTQVIDPNTGDLKIQRPAWQEARGARFGNNRKMWARLKKKNRKKNRKKFNDTTDID